MVRLVIGQSQCSLPAGQSAQRSAGKPCGIRPGTCRVSQIGSYDSDAGQLGMKFNPGDAPSAADGEQEVWMIFTQHRAVAIGFSATAIAIPICGIAECPHVPRPRPGFRSEGARIGAAVADLCDPTPRMELRQRTVNENGISGATADNDDMHDWHPYLSCRVEKHAVQQVAGIITPARALHTRPGSAAAAALPERLDPSSIPGRLASEWRGTAPQSGEG